MKTKKEIILKWTHITENKIECSVDLIESIMDDYLNEISKCEKCGKPTHVSYTCNNTSCEKAWESNP